MINPRSVVLAGLLLVGWASACSDGTAPDSPETSSPLGLVVSDLTSPESPLQSAARISTGAADSDDLVYASLLPGTDPRGTVASVRSLATSSLVWTTVSDGGFDPVAVTATPDDTIEIIVRDGAAVVHEERVPVAALRAPGDLGTARPATAP
jgi:hypothetical protein